MHSIQMLWDILIKINPMRNSLLGGFPAGTVSGAPKIRAMEIIDQLRKNKRKL